MKFYAFIFSFLIPLFSSYPLAHASDSMDDKRAEIQVTSKSYSSTLTRLGFPETHQQGYTGSGVHIVVLDRPIPNEHEALDSKKIEILPSFTGEFDLTTLEKSPHGLQVTSLILGENKNKILGGCPTAKVYKGNIYNWGLKSEEEIQNWETLFQSIEKLGKVDIINISATAKWPTEGILYSLKSLLQTKDALLVLAAGNDSKCLYSEEQKSFLDLTHKAEQFTQFMTDPEIAQRTIFACNIALKKENDKVIENYKNKLGYGSFQLDKERVRALLLNTLKENTKSLDYFSRLRAKAVAKATSAIPDAKEIRGEIIALQEATNYKRLKQLRACLEKGQTQLAKVPEEKEKEAIAKKILFFQKQIDDLKKKIENSENLVENSKLIEEQRKKYHFKITDYITSKIEKVFQRNTNTSQYKQELLMMMGLEKTSEGYRNRLFQEAILGYSELLFPVTSKIDKNLCLALSSTRPVSYAPHALATFGTRVLVATEGQELYMKDTGTSLSAPLISAALALCQEKTGLKGVALKEHLFNTSDPVSKEEEIYFGHRILNLKKGLGL